MTLQIDAPHVFAALGDPVRSAIVTRLADGDLTVTEIAAAFPISLQAISKHIKLLEAAGVVSQTKVGRTRPVRLETKVLAQTAGWLEAQRLRRDYDRLDDLLVELHPDRTPPKETP